MFRSVLAVPLRRIVLRFEVRTSGVPGLADLGVWD